eukprot:3667050-Ditylum_brightwellii.AAC.1
MDYERVLPPGSFIYAHEFDTPGALVQYLRYLDGKETAYREYFQWKNEGYRVVGHEYGANATLEINRGATCGLCSQLFIETVAPRDNTFDLEQWWTGECKR